MRLVHFINGHTSHTVGLIYSTEGNSNIHTIYFVKWQFFEIGNNFCNNWIISVIIHTIYFITYLVNANMRVKPNA